jgi:hypothetical protein
MKYEAMKNNLFVCIVAFMISMCYVDKIGRKPAGVIAGISLLSFTVLAIKIQRAGVAKGGFLKNYFEGQRIALRNRGWTEDRIEQDIEQQRQRIRQVGVSFTWFMKNNAGKFQILTVVLLVAFAPITLPIAVLNSVRMYRQWKLFQKELEDERANLRAQELAHAAANDPNW